MVSDDLIEVVVFDFVVRKLLVEQPIDQMLLDLLDWLLDHEVFDLNQVFIKLHEVKKLGQIKSNKKLTIKTIHHLTEWI